VFEMSVKTALPTDDRPASERWLWRLMTAGLVALAAGLVAVGLTLYV
jgi:hypothetical protein